MKTEEEKVKDSKNQPDHGGSGLVESFDMTDPQERDEFLKVCSENGIDMDEARIVAALQYDSTVNHAEISEDEQWITA